MVGVSLEELTISESSPEASTAPTTLTSHSSSNLSHDFLPRFPNPAPRERSRKERSSSSLTETLTKDVSSLPSCNRAAWGFRHYSRASHVFAIQLSLLLRSNSRLKCDKHTGSQTVRPFPTHPPSPPTECAPQVLHPLPEEYKDNSDYAHNLSRNSSNLSKLDLESRMLRQRDTDKVKRSENKVRKRYSPMNHYHPLFSSLPSSLFFRSVRFLYVSSDAKSSSMVSFAEAVSLRVQRRKSDVRALPTRSSRWTKHCKALSLSQTAATPYQTMPQDLVFRTSNTAQSVRRHDHHPSLPSLSTNNCLNPLQTSRRRLPAQP